MEWYIPHDCISLTFLGYFITLVICYKIQCNIILSSLVILRHVTSHAAKVILHKNLLTIAWLTRLCVPHLVHCQVQSKDRLIEQYGSLHGLGVDIPLFLNPLDIFAESILVLLSL